MIKVLIFDLDDTLYYEKEYVLGALENVAEFLGNKYGKDSNTLHNRMVQILDEQGRGKIFDIVCHENGFNESISSLVDVYRDSKPDLTLYEDSVDFIKWAKNQEYKLGIITDGCGKVQRNKIHALELEKMVDKIIISDDLGREFWKPHKASYINMSDFFNVKTNECIYVGDNPNKDFIGAKELGMKTIRNNRKNGDHINTFLDNAHEADYIIKNLYELKELLIKENI